MNDHPELAGPRGRIRRAVESVVDAAVTRPLTVILLALLVIFAAKQYISAKLELRSDFL